MKQEFEGNYEEVVDNFDNMNLQEDLLRGIYAYGFEKPSAIQQRAIMPLVKGLDIIAQAQSGTGKKANHVDNMLFVLFVCFHMCLSLRRVFVVYVTFPRVNVCGVLLWTLTFVRLPSNAHELRSVQCCCILLHRLYRSIAYSYDK
jgi:hypothetical protein